MLVLHCSGARGRRGIQAGIAEKKISILERALEFHPGSDRLLMALLDAVSFCHALSTTAIQCIQYICHTLSTLPYAYYICHTLVSSAMHSVHLPYTQYISHTLSTSPTHSVHCHTLTTSATHSVHLPYTQYICHLLSVFATNSLQLPVNVPYDEYTCQHICLTLSTSAMHSVHLPCTQYICHALSTSACTQCIFALLRK